jgi:hypothetical protein
MASHACIHVLGIIPMPEEAEYQLSCRCESLVHSPTQLNLPGCGRTLNTRRPQSTFRKQLMPQESSELLRTPCGVSVEIFEEYQKLSVTVEFVQVSQAPSGGPTFSIFTGTLSEQYEKFHLVAIQV